jgi:hypothetical protein
MSHAIVGTIRSVLLMKFPSLLENIPDRFSNVNHGDQEAVKCAQPDFYCHVLVIRRK